MCWLVRPQQSLRFMRNGEIKFQAWRNARKTILQHCDVVRRAWVVVAGEGFKRRVEHKAFLDQKAEADPAQSLGPLHHRLDCPCFV